MPYIDTKTSAHVTPQQKQDLFKKMGKIIEDIPGKTEEWLMLNIEGGCSMCFRGDADTPCAMVDVRIFGAADSQAYENMTKDICKIFDEVLHIPSDRVYICYKGYSEWGWNHKNF